LSARSWSTPLIIFPSRCRFTNSRLFPNCYTFVMQFSLILSILILLRFLRGLRFSIEFLLKFTTIMFTHSERASILEMDCPGKITLKITSGENFRLIVLRMGSVNLPPRSYFSLRYWERSLNFSILISLRFAPSSLELMLLSLTSPVFLCLDIVIL